MYRFSIISTIFYVVFWGWFSDESLPNNGDLNNTQDEVAVRDTSYVRKLNERASDLITHGKLDSASTLIKEAFHLSNLLDDKEGEAYAMANLGNYYLYRGQPDSAIASLEEPYQRLKDTERALYIGNALGTAYYRVNDYSNSLETYLDVLERAKEKENKTIQAAVTQNLGNTYSDLGDVPSSIDSYLESLNLAEQLADTNTIAVVLDNLGSINSEEGNYEIAEDYLQRALRLSKMLGNLQYQITNHMNLGILYKDMGQYDESERHYEKVLEISDQLGNVFTPLQAKYNLGVLYSEMGEYEKALDYFRESLELSRQNNIQMGFFYNQSGIADIYLQRNEYDKAIDNYESSLGIAENTGSLDLEKQALEKLYDAYEKTGDTVQAYQYLKRYSAITDSLSKTERDKALARQEIVLGLRNEREKNRLLEDAIEAQHRNSIIVWSLLGVILIVLIAVVVLYRNKRRANIELRKKTEELSEVNEVKDKLLSVLSHDLRTPIASIQGVVYMIRENLLDKEDLDNALAHIDFQLQQGINTLTNYLEWAQNHRGKITAELENVQLINVVEDALSDIRKSAENKDIQIINNVTGETLALADKHMMNVILRNLLSNAIKYVNSGDKVIIEAKETNSGVELFVRDTGEGIPDEKQKNLFKPFSRVTKGTKGEIGTGLGLSLCKEFCEKQGGSIHCESEMGKGTAFTVVLRKTKQPTGKEQTFAK